MPPAHPAANHVDAADSSVRLQPLLVGYDGSDASATASAFALRLAGNSDAEATLVHVCPELRYAPHAAHTGPPEPLTAAPEQRLAAVADWRRQLEGVRDLAAADTDVASTVVPAARRAGSSTMRRAPWWWRVTQKKMQEEER